MGMQEVHHDFMTVLVPIAIEIAFVTIGRAVSTYLCCAAFIGSSLKVETNYQHVLFWGGLRGALALALGLPLELPHRNDIVAVSFAVVAFSIFVQGLTITPLLQRLGEITPIEHQ